MKRTRVLVIGGVVVAVAAGIGAGVAIAVNGDDHEQPITGEALQQASAVALAHTGGGRVTGTEVGDEDSYYEVEVTLDDGSQVDVQLDVDFRVVGTNPDRESEGGSDD